MPTLKDQNTMATATTAPEDTMPPIELDLDRAPTEPNWFREGRSALLGCETLDELEIVCRSLVKLDDGKRALLRPIKVTHERKLRAAVQAIAASTDLLGQPHSTEASGPAPVVGEPAAPSVVPASDEALADVLGGIAAVATANAATLDTTHGGVAASDVNSVAGFNSPQAYATAARNAVTAATRAQYIASARAGGIIVDESTLPPLPTLDLPLSQNPTVTIPTGPSIFDQPRAQRVFRPGTTTATAAKVTRPLVTAGDLIMGSIAAGAGASVSWSRARNAVALPATQLIAALATIDRQTIAPKIKSSKAQFGAVMGSLNSRGLVARAATRMDAAKRGMDWPTNVAARWIVGTMDTTANLESLGEKHLIADLCTDNTIQFHGGETLAAKVRDAFNARTTENTYSSTDLVQWLESVLRREHHGITWGGMIYIPGGEVAAVKLLVKTIRDMLGRAVAVACVTTEEDLIAGLGEGLLDEVVAVEHGWNLALTDAQERARAKATEAKHSAALIDLAAARATVTPARATTLMRDLSEVVERVSGYETMLGARAVAKAKALIAVLEGKLRPLLDETSSRAAMLEMD